MYEKRKMTTESRWCSCRSWRRRGKGVSGHPLQISTSIRNFSRSKPSHSSFPFPLSTKGIRFIIPHHLHLRRRYCSKKIVPGRDEGISVLWEKDFNPWQKEEEGELLLGKKSLVLVKSPLSCKTKYPTSSYPTVPSAICKTQIKRQIINQTRPLIEGAPSLKTPHGWRGWEQWRRREMNYFIILE